jgi:hypothetical protein
LVRDPESARLDSHIVYLACRSPRKDAGGNETRYARKLGLADLAQGANSQSRKLAIQLSIDSVTREVVGWACEVRNESDASKWVSSAMLMRSCGAVADSALTGDHHPLASLAVFEVEAGNSCALAIVASNKTVEHRIIIDKIDRRQASALSGQPRLKTTGCPIAQSV